ncbi:MAG: hypothetical protein EOO85_08690 [Pedobacter sp.]|nr:MAG: hypothetical protein EOO85_08690 [Pedobacter sp.]
MDQIRLVEPPKERFSWVKEFVKTDVGEKFKYPEEFKKTVSPIKSRDVKIQMPGAEFEQDETSEQGFVIITRTK